MKDMRNDNSIEPEFGPRAVSVYGGDAMDDFPVLKAFQQYIDAEHAKARKRLFAMGVFSGVFMLVVVAVFVVLLVNVSNRNQQLNDRLVEFAMKERGAGSAVVVQPPQDSATVLALTSKIEEMNRKISEAQEKADKAVAEAEAKVRQAAAAAEAAKPRPPSPEELEIQRLKKLLADEKEKAAAEKARQREAELEAYRRKHYPELYVAQPQPPVAAAAAQQPVVAPATTGTTAAQPAATSPAAAQPPSSVNSPARSAAPARLSRDEIDRILDDLDRIDQEALDDDDEDEEAAEADEGELKPISYFDAANDDDKDDRPRPKKAKKKASDTKSTTGKDAVKSPSPSKPAKKPAAAPEADARTLSVGTGDAAESWNIPE